MLLYVRHTTPTEEILMAYVFDKDRTRTWLRGSASPCDVVALLSASLMPGWEVEREIDPTGDISIIVLSAIDDPAMPTFTLYESEGKAMVGTVTGDAWEKVHGFSNCQRAVAAILAATLSASYGTRVTDTDGATYLVRHASPVRSLSRIDGRSGGMDVAPAHGATGPGGL
jgi:hypothetical protein